MMITVAICTYNNALSLDITLSSLCKLVIATDLEYEILIIDNNCTDNTPEITKKYESILPNLRVVYEQKQGLSNARNCALMQAKGEIVSFIDDDVEVDPYWLGAVAEAFKKYNATLVGGKSYLIYPDKKPAWLTEKLETYLSRIDYGCETLVNTDKELFGLNFSVLKQSALQIGGFDTNLGRIGKKLLSGEEIKLQYLIRKNNEVVIYEPKAVVGHIVPRQRLTKKWFLSRAYYAGFTNCVLNLTNENRSTCHYFKLTLRCHLGIVKSILIRDCDAQTFFEKQMFAMTSLGLFVASFKNNYHSKMQP